MLEAQVPLKKRSENGQSLVEFAVSLVILMLLLSVIVDGARALFTYLSMRDASQEGALYASYKPNDSSGIQSFRVWSVELDERPLRRQQHNNHISSNCDR